MAEFKSKYSGLGFYVDGSPRFFRGGRYVTEDKAEIDVLTKLSDVTRVDEVVEPKAKPKAATEGGAADKPEKPAAPKKKGGKSSGK